MLLGIEIGGTKLQLGVGRGDGVLVALERLEVEPERGACGILERIQTTGATLVARHGVRGVGVGFGGPVDVNQGRVVKSHQVEGWDNFLLTRWMEVTLGVPAVLGNDADVAALAEARYGAGRGRNPVFYITVGTGIGGGLIVDGSIYRGSGLGAAEIGHLRPGLHADGPEQTVEAIASGSGIAAAAQACLVDPFLYRLQPFIDHERRPSPEAVRQRLIAEEEAVEEYASDLLSRCEGDAERLTAKMVGQAAAEGNALAQHVLQHAWQTLGWAIAQTVTLLAPQVVVIGGGVSLLGEHLFFEPVRAAIQRYAFPPFAKRFEVLPAHMGEEMVVHGALVLAADASRR